MSSIEQKFCEAMVKLSSFYYSFDTFSNDRTQENLDELVQDVKMLDETIEMLKQAVAHNIQSGQDTENNQESGNDSLYGESDGNGVKIPMAKRENEDKPLESKD